MQTPIIAALVGFLLVGQAPGQKIIPNHAVADLVLGQPDFITSSFAYPLTAYKSSNPACVVVDPVSRKVFVGETSGDRILRYPSVEALTNGAPAEAVFGTANFTDSNGGSDASGLQDPSGLFLDRFGRLWVADSANNRVVAYDAAIYRENQPTANLVFGQPDFTTTLSGTTASKMSSPTGVWIDGNDNLWVADSGNNRVLRFGSISTKASGAAADGLLGQALFTTFAPIFGPAGLQTPESIAVSPAGVLYVACRGGHRVMCFNNAATLGDGAPANAVLGQPDFDTVASGITANKLTGPKGVFLTPDNSLWVCDSFNNRVLRFSNVATKGTGSAADGVVGQPDFTTNLTAATGRGLSSPGLSPYVDATGSLWVPDSGNNRVLRFPPDVTSPVVIVVPRLPTDVTAPTVKVATKIPVSTRNKTITLKGTANDFYGVSKIKYKVNSGSTQTASGTTNWQFKVALKKGKNTITIKAVDSVGNISTNKVLKITRK